MTHGPLVGSLLAALLALPANAQRDTADIRGIVRGIVRDARGPVSGANVFVVGTLDGAISDSAGRFAFSTLRRPTYPIGVSHASHRESRVTIADSERHGVQ